MMPREIDLLVTMMEPVAQQVVNATYLQSAGEREGKRRPEVRQSPQRLTVIT